MVLEEPSNLLLGSLLRFLKVLMVPGGDLCACWQAIPLGAASGGALPASGAASGRCPYDPVWLPMVLEEPSNLLLGTL